jgi:hypothetical protein
MRKGQPQRAFLRVLLVLLVLAAGWIYQGALRESIADSAYKVITANPTFTVGILRSGDYLNTQTADNTYMQVREAWSGFVARLDMQLNSWQAFNEAPRTKLLDIAIELEGYQNNADDSWYVQFYNYDAGAWDTSWYFLGSLPTTPDGTLQVAVGNATLARRFVSAAGAFRLRFVDNNTVSGGTDGTRTRLYIDLLRARFVYDITPPASSITAPVDMEYTNAHSYTVRGVSGDPGQDPSGVSLVEVSTDGGASWSAATPAAPGDYSSWSYNWTVPGEGTYTVRSRATDAVNNVETPGAGVRVVVDWTPPQVSSVTPPGGSINVGVDTLVTARFSEANGMDAGTVNAATFTLTDEEGTPIAGSVTYDPGTMTATFDPASDLFYGYVYTARLSTGITDVAGNPLPADYSWSFRTADILTMSLVDTYKRDGTPGGGAVDFGSMNPEGSPYVVGGGPAPYAVKLRILSSTGWNLFANATSDLTDATQSPPAVIPISQMQWMLSGGGSWTPFTLSASQVFPAAQNRTPQPGGSELPFDLRLELTWEDLPGNYSTTIVFFAMVQP